MSTKEIKQGNLTWTHISHIDDAAIEYLKASYKFHHLDMEDVQSEVQTPKLDAYENYLFLVLHFPQFKENSNKITPHEVDIFLGDNFLITIQNGKNKEIKNLFYRFMGNRKMRTSWMSSTSGYLLYKLVEHLYSNTRPLLNTIGKNISDIENQIFSGRQNVAVIHELALYRRNVLSIRRILDPQRYIVATLSHTRKTFLDESLSLYFDNVKDYLDKLWVIIDSYKETIDGLHLTVESIINQQTNKVIRALTMISVSMLPLTLLSGIYGMNLIHLPFANDPKWVWGLFAVLTTIIISLMITARKRKWL